MNEPAFNVRTFVYRNRYLFLFIALLLPYFLHPLASTPAIGIVLLDLSFSLILVMGVFAVSSQKKIAVTALALVIVSQLLTWSTQIVTNLPLILIGIALNCIYLIYTASVLLRRILIRSEVTSQTIFSALCVYLLIGFIWAFIYSFLEILHPGSFQINHTLFANEPSGKHVFSELYYFFYFSFTTLTTLGYGDIIPASDWTRVFASIEAMIGQLYLVVLVSRLVGLHIAEVVHRGSKE